MTYNIVDHSEHHDIHRGFIDLDGKELNIVITHEGIVMYLYDDVNGCDLVATFARTFGELAEWMKEEN